MPRMVIKMEDGFYIANVFMEINISFLREIRTGGRC